MGRSANKVYETEYPYFITSSVAGGITLFSDQRMSDIILDSLKFIGISKGALIHAYVIMPDHIHIVVQHNELTGIMRSFKSFTARQIIDTLIKLQCTELLACFREHKINSHRDCEYQVWQEGFHPKMLTTQAIAEQKIDYIHHNPVRRGLVNRPEDWVNSSAGLYSGGSGPVPVTLLF